MRGKSVSPSLLVNLKSLGISTLVLIIAIFALIVNGVNENANTLMAIGVIAINLLSLYHAKKNLLLSFIVLVITYYNYSICAANYIWRIRTTMFTGYAETDIGHQGLRILLIFSLMLYLVVLIVALSMREMNERASIIIDNQNNVLIEVVLSILLVFIWVYGFGRPSSPGKRGAPSTYFEYSIILIILGYYYSGKSVFWKTIISVIGISYAGLNFIYGGRATGIQMIICMLFCTILDKIPKKWIVLAGFILFLLMSLVGEYRTTAVLSADSVKFIWERLKATRFANDTAYSSYFTSMTFLDYGKDCSWANRTYYFSRWLLSIPLGGRVTDSNLPVITRQFYVHYFGGVLPYYFQFFMGYVGLGVISIYIYWLLLKMFVRNCRKSGLWRCIRIYVASTSLRWYIYSPSQISRGVLLMSVAYAVLFIANKVMQRSGDVGTKLIKSRASSMLRT